MSDGKIDLVPFEAARDVPGDAQTHSLSARSQLLALSQTGYLHWMSRWYKQDGTELSDSEKEDIEDWAAQCEVDLLVPLSVTEQAPTPFWDEDSEVDDSAPVDIQTWYGSVADPEAAPAELDFVENLAIFAFTGFLAVATWEIGAAPAILFHTIAPKFVLAVRRGNVGEIIRILIDGEEAARVDTAAKSEGDIINIPIVADPAITTGHDIMLVQVS